VAATESPGGAPAAPAARRALVALGVTLVVALGVVVGAAVVGTAPAGAGRPSSSPIATLAATATVPVAPTLPPTVGPSAAPSPEPTPALVPSALTGLLVTEEAAIRHPVAVMIDDHAGARPQSGFNAASIVWQAPAEGGIPRYMLIFQDQIPGNVGPVRSSRQYFIEWAAEWRAMYVHAGGSAQALATLAQYGHGQYVWNADNFRWEGTYLFRVNQVKVFDGPTYPLVRPHNVYTDGPHLRQLAAQIGAVDGPLTPAWTFGVDIAPRYRPVGARITVAYAYEAIQYRYDATTNTYRRYIKPPLGGPFQPQIDAADGKQVAPKNVVVLQMAFGPLYPVGTDPHHRLEARDVGHGVAWISTDGITVKGTWRKASITAPTLLYGPNGQPITFTAGQTFVQVMRIGDLVQVQPGARKAVPPMGAMPNPL
jgi:hypothetical protein